MKKTVILILMIGLIISLTGCGKLLSPTYPKEEIPQAIRNLCQKEYGIDEKIDVKIVGKTLGVRINLDGLVDINLKIKEEALDKVQKLLRIIRRICLSTNADLDFYVIIGYEKTVGIEIVFYSYVTDLQKAVAGWMSPEDYFERLIRTMRLDTLRWGNIRISKFIKDIESGNMIKVIIDNFATGTKLSNLNSKFLKVLTDLSKKSSIKWHLVKQHSIPVGFEKRLYHIEAKEYFTPNETDTEELFYSSGTVHKFYVLITMEELNPVIEAIYSEEELPEQYISLGEPDTWLEDDFFVEDFVFHEFLSTQIVQQIQLELTKEKDEDEKFPFNMEGNFIIEDSIDREVQLKEPSNNIFKLTFKPKESTSKELNISEKIMDVCTKAVREVCNKYKFYDLGELKFQDNKGNSLLTLDKPTLFKR